MALPRQSAFGGWNGGSPPRIDLDGHAQRPRQSLETGFRYMVIVRSIQRLDMERHTAVHGERLEELAKQLGFHLADQRPRKGNLPDEIAAAGEVEGAAGQGFIHRQVA